MRKIVPTLVLLVTLAAPIVNAQPRRAPDTPAQKIVKIIRHLIGLDDPSVPKP